MSGNILRDMPGVFDAAGNLVGFVNLRGAEQFLGTGSGDVVKANNLSDLADTNAARTNIGAASADELADTAAALTELQATVEALPDTGLDTAALAEIDLVELNPSVAAVADTADAAAAAAAAAASTATSAASTAAAASSAATSAVSTATTAASTAVGAATTATTAAAAVAGKPDLQSGTTLSASTTLAANPTAVLNAISPVSSTATAAAATAATAASTATGAATTATAAAALAATKAPGGSTIGLAGTSLTISATHDGSVIETTSASPVVITLNSSTVLVSGFGVIRSGVGNVSFAGTATLTGATAALNDAVEELCVVPTSVAGTYRVIAAVAIPADGAITTAAELTDIISIELPTINFPLKMRLEALDDAMAAFVVGPPGVLGAFTSAGYAIGDLQTFTPAVGLSGTMAWYRDGVPISGATSLTYTLVADDLPGKTITPVFVPTSFSPGSIVSGIPPTMGILTAATFSPGSAVDLSAVGIDDWLWSATTSHNRFKSNDIASYWEAGTGFENDAGSPITYTISDGQGSGFDHADTNDVITAKVTNDDAALCTRYMAVKIADYEQILDVFWSAGGSGNVTFTPTISSGLATLAPYTRAVSANGGERYHVKAGTGVATYFELRITAALADGPEFIAFGAMALYPA